MDNNCIEGRDIKLYLLDKEDLKTWKGSVRLARERLGMDIDAEEISGNLLNAFNIKIRNMENNPGHEKWYSYYAIVHDGKIIGTIGPKGKPDEGNTIEIGYGINEKYRNRGIATEAVGLLCEYLFQAAGIGKIIAETDADNISSQRVLEKNGFAAVEKTEDSIRWELRKPVSARQRIQ